MVADTVRDGCRVTGTTRASPHPKLAVNQCGASPVGYVGFVWLGSVHSVPRVVVLPRARLHQQVRHEAVQIVRLEPTRDGKQHGVGKNLPESTKGSAIAAQLRFTHSTIDCEGVLKTDLRASGPTWSRRGGCAGRWTPAPEPTRGPRRACGNTLAGRPRSPGRGEERALPASLACVRDTRHACLSKDEAHAVVAAPGSAGQPGMRG